MKYRKLGRTGLDVSEIGFGTWAIGGHNWGVQDDDASLAALSRAYELGVNFYDAALIYGYGRSERLLGDFVRGEGIRDSVYIATKIPPMNLRWPATKDVSIDQVYPRHHMENLVNESLRNLKLGPIDVLHLHAYAEHFTDDDVWWDTLTALKASGKVRFFGVALNNFEPESAIRLVKTRPLDVLQVQYNIFEQAPAEALLPACAAANVGVIARAPLEEGALTGKFGRSHRFAEGDFRAVYFAAHRMGQMVDRVEKLRPLLARGNDDLTLGALRFCLSSPQVACVIPGIRSVKQAEHNVKASDLGPLSPEVLSSLRGHRWLRSYPDW